MNAPLSKHELNFSLGNLSYIGPEYDEGAVPAVKPERRHGIGTWFARASGALAQWHHRRVVMQELAQMTDRELSDIGLSRCDLPRVFDDMTRS